MGDGHGRPHHGAAVPALRALAADGATAAAHEALAAAADGAPAVAHEAPAAAPEAPTTALVVTGRSDEATPRGGIARAETARYLSRYMIRPRVRS